MAYQRTEITAPTGINKDLSPYELPPNVWSDGENINFRRNRTNKQLGYENPFQIAGTSISPIWLQYFGNRDESFWVYANGNTVMKTDGLTIDTLGSGFSASRDKNWSGEDFNGVLVMNNENNQPQYLPEDPVLPRVYDQLVDLPFWGVAAFDTIPPESPEDPYQWGADSRCKVIRPYKNYLFALDNWDAFGTHYNNMIRWSSPAQLGDVPPSWDPNSPSEQAGLYALADTPGRIVDGMTLGDYFVVYKTDSVWLVQFIGGDFNFSFRKLFGDEAGMLATECMAEFDGKHFVLSNTGAYVHNGATKQEVMDPWVKDQFFNNVSEEQLKNTRVVADHNNKEMWVYYTTKDSGTSWCDQACVWNWEHGTWTIRELTGISYIAEGFAKSEQETEDPDWDGDDQSWNDDITIWNSDASANPAQLALMLSDPIQNQLYLNESATTQATHLMTGYVERIGIDFNDDFSFKYLTRVIPHIIGQDLVTITIFASNTEVTVPTGQSQAVFNPEEDWDIDCHVTGRYLGIRFSCNGDFQLDGYTLVWEQTGEQ